MSDDGKWFAPNRYGIRASWPISWQGWVLTTVFIILISLSALLIRHSIFGYLSLTASLTSAFLVICACTTRGGWRWLWGQRE